MTQNPKIMTNPKSPTMAAIEASRAICLVEKENPKSIDFVQTGLEQVTFREALAVLYEAVEKAPHPTDLCYFHYSGQCTCWAGKALKAADELCQKLLEGTN